MTQPTKLLYKIAKAYYEDQLTQQRIADRFGLSRIKVSRLLNQARRDKIVQIIIQAPSADLADLERAIEKKYRIKEAVVVTCPREDANTVVEEMGSVGAKVLCQCLQGKETVGITWGRSLLPIVDALPNISLPGVRIVQLNGGLGELESPTHGADLARRMAETFDARPRLLHAPGLVKNKSVRDALVTDPQVADTLKLAAEADVALVGIGVIKPGSTLLNAGLLSREEITELKAKGAVGDIGMQFFDNQGRRVAARVEKRTLGLSLEAIRKIPRVIGVAGGREKVEVVRAALKGALVDVLVTDLQTAKQLID